MSVAQENNQSSMPFSLDNEKAFDWLNRLFLECTLEKMELHLDFINWIKVLYASPRSRVQVNGHTFEQSELKRGNRQGYLLSPLLFAIGIEPLAEMIRETPLIYGMSDVRDIIVSR